MIWTQRTKRPEAALLSCTGSRGYLCPRPPGIRMLASLQSRSGQIPKHTLPVQSTIPDLGAQPSPFCFFIPKAQSPPLLKSLNWPTHLTQLPFTFNCPLAVPPPPNSICTWGGRVKKWGQTDRTVRGTWGLRRWRVLVRLTPALTSPFSAEEEVSWGSQRPVCLLGQECPSLVHPLLLRASLSSALWQHPSPLAS